MKPEFLKVMMNAIPVSYQEFPSRKWPFFILLALFLILFFGISSKENKSQFSNELLAFVFLAPLLIFYIVLMKLKIIIDDDGFEMQMLFKRERIKWDLITKSNIAFEFTGDTGDVKWIFESNVQKTFSFSPTFFSRDQLRQVAEALQTRSPKAQISARIQRMAEGKFPWYIF